MRRFKTTFTICLALAVLSTVSLAVVYYNRVDPFVYVALLWFAACVVTVVRSRTGLRLWALYFGTAVLVLGGFEAYLAGWFCSAKRNFSLTDPSYFQSHPVLGYSPKRNAQTRASKSNGHEEFYNVQYTIGPNGARIGPQKCDEIAPVVAFFGGSFTFGEGVNDSEALPYQFQAKSNGRFKAHNFGFHGYGPHQMLAMLQNGLERQILAGQPPDYVIYTAIPGHVQRSAGRAMWDKSGPRYVLDGDGKVRLSGPFQNWFVSNCMRVLTRSNLIRRVLSLRHRPSKEDIRLFAAIVAEAKQIIDLRYGAEFYVLLWSTKSRLAQEIADELSRLQIPLLRVQDAIPDFDANLSKYTIRYPLEQHPNVQAYAAVAEFLDRFIESARQDTLLVKP